MSSAEADARGLEAVREAVLLDRAGKVRDWVMQGCRWNWVPRDIPDVATLPPHKRQALVAYLNAINGNEPRTAKLIAPEKDGDMRVASERVTGFGGTHLHAHGTPTGVYAKEGFIHGDAGARKIAELCKDGEYIQLWCCDTGCAVEGGVPFAQLVADASGKAVVAPDGEPAIELFGLSHIKTGWPGSTGRWRLFLPRA